MERKTRAETPKKKPIESIGSPSIDEANRERDMEKITILDTDIAPMSTIGRLIYRNEDGSLGTVYMDHRCFWNFVEGVGDPVGKTFGYDGDMLIPMEV